MGMGIDWVMKYNGRAADVSNTKAAARGFYNTLQAVRQYEWGDDLAWDTDFEQQGAGTPLSGSDSAWADNVDIAFFAGHGNAQGPFFGTMRDSGQATPSEVRLGDIDLEWIAFHACQVLERADVFNRWGPSFRGLHYILGFDTTCHDETHRGTYFADHLNNGWRVRDAWIAAAQETENSDTWWAYLRADAAGTNTYQDHWHGKGFVSSDPDVPNIHFYLRGAC